ncbi:hypothetical protein ACOMHN_039178 [Nucella lapillus]
MQGRQENHYDGMIIADPNMILNVTVPETVQKQADNWERGTRTLLQRSVLKPSPQPPNHQLTAESGISAGLKTDDQAKHSSTERKFGKKGQPQKENVCLQGEQKKIPGEELQKLCSDERTEFHLQRSYRHTQQGCCGDKNPPVPSKPTYRETQPLRDHNQQQPAYATKQEPPAFFSQIHCIKNTTHFQRCLPPPSLQHHQTTNTRRFQLHRDTVTADCETINLASAQDWLQYEYFKYHAQPACGLPEAPYPGCCSRLQRVSRHTTLTTMLSKRTTTLPARRGLRPRYRRWTDSSTEEFVMPQRGSSHVLQTCCKSYGMTSSSCRLDQGLLSSVWMDSGASLFPRHAQHSGVFLSATSHHQDVVLTSEQSGQRSSSSEDLMDLSVEETVDYFLKMTSPLDVELEDSRTDSTNVTAAPFESLHWNVWPASIDFS